MKLKQFAQVVLAIFHDEELLVLLVRRQLNQSDNVFMFAIEKGVKLSLINTILLVLLSQVELLDRILLAISTRQEN